MGIVIFYIIINSFFLISVLLIIYSSLRYLYVKRNKDVCINSFFVIVSCWPILCIDFSIFMNEIVYGHKSTILNKNLLLCLFFFMIVWFFCGSVLFISSNHFIKVEDDYIVVSSVFGVQTKINISEIVKSKSIRYERPNSVKFGLDTHIILYYKGCYFSIFDDLDLYSFKNDKYFYFYHNLKLKMINNKSEYKEIVKKCKPKSLFLLLKSNVLK